MSERSLGIVRGIGVGAVAGALAGALVGGFGSRIAMRISGAGTGAGSSITTANGNELGVITLGGTLALVVFAGIIPGVLAGVLYGLVRPSLARFGRAGGLVFGAWLLAVGGSLVLDPANFDFQVFGRPWLNVLMFASLFVLFGVVIAPLYAVVERNSRGAASLGEVQILSVLVWLAVLPGAAMLLTLAAVSVGNVVTLVRLGALSVADFATVILGAAGVTAVGVAFARGRMRAPAYAAFGLVLAYAAVQTAGAIGRILSGSLA